MSARALRRRFDRAARGYDDAAKLDAEIGARMLERLDYVRVSPARVLDAGAGTGRDARALAQRYPRASVFALDLSEAMLRRGRGSFLDRLRGRAALAACADLARLPLAHGSIDLAWSNLVLHWIDEPQAALREFARVLRPEGLLMFSSYGPDSFVELGDARATTFVDMHDLGDMLVACGFADPVMDMERITLTYADATAFLADARASVQARPRAQLRGLGGRARIAALSAGLEARRAGGRLAITVEIVYGHAWKSAQGRTADGHAIVGMPTPRRAPR